MSVLIRRAGIPPWTGVGDCCWMQDILRLYIHVSPAVGLASGIRGRYAHIVSLVISQKLLQCQTVFASTAGTCKPSESCQLADLTKKEMDDRVVAVFLPKAHHASLKAGVAGM